MGVPCPPPARPLAILPPPIFGAAVSAQEPPESEPEIPLETTADQTAVLEFLSGADGVPAIARSRDD